LLGLLPIIGLPCALAALWISGRTRLKERTILEPGEVLSDWRCHLRDLRRR